MLGLIRRIINILFGAIELLLGLRFFFKFFMVAESSQFTGWLYGITSQLVAPFAGITANLKMAGFVVDLPTLIALVFYSLFGYFLLRVLPY